MREVIWEGRLSPAEKRRIKNFMKFIVLVIIVYFVAVKIKENYYSRITIRGNELIRDIYYISETFEEPSDRTEAWDSELPKFVSSDFEYMDNHPEITKIQYKFNDGKFIIRNDENNEKYVEVVCEKYTNKDEPGIYIDFEELNNFSIYIGKTNIRGHKKITIYGYNVHHESAFYKYEFELTDFKAPKVSRNLITNQSEIPFNDYKSKVLYRFNDYTLCLNQYNDELCIYHNKKIVYDNCNLQDVEKTFENGMCITSYNELYMPYIVFDGKQPKIRIERIGDIDDESTYGTVIISNSNMAETIPIFKKDGEYCIPIPNSWETFRYYVKNDNIKIPANPDFGMKLVPIKNVFKKARFHYNDVWYANILLDLNGIEGKINYSVNGYDNRITLREEETEKSVVVDNIIDFWVEIENIRNLYREYYDYPG
jgi:hypothetical protein